MLVVSESKIKNAARNMDCYCFYKEAKADGSKSDAIYMHLAKKYGITKQRVMQIITAQKKKWENGNQ